MYVADVIEELNSLNFPQLFTAKMQQSIVRDALRKLDRYRPQTAFAVFPTIELVQDYYIFNENDQPYTNDPNKASQTLFDENGAELNTGPWVNGNIESEFNTSGVVYENNVSPWNTSATPYSTSGGGTIISGPGPTYTGTLGVCSTALSVEDVYWNPGGDFTSLNIFSPGWQMLANVQLYSGSYFNQPSQMMIVSQKLASWQNQFGSQGFEVMGQTGNPGAFLRLYPAPLEDGDLVIVRFKQKNNLADIGYGDHLYDDMMIWVKHYTARALANYYSNTAGMQILGFTDSAKAMQYWDAQANKYEEHALIQMAGLHGEVARSN